MNSVMRNRISGSSPYEHADCHLPEFFDWRHVRQSVPGTGQHLPCTKPADTARCEGWKGLGVLQMTTLGDKANFWFALVVLAWLLTDTLGAWL